MSQPKYLICPGHVFGRYDDQEHFIGAQHLARLYGVRLDECIVDPGFGRRQGWKEPVGLIVLRPRYSGDYTLATAAKSPLSGEET